MAENADRIPARPGERRRKLAGIPVRIAGRAVLGAGRKLLGANAEQIDAELDRKAAEQVFAVLGELKGGAMKFGQALSVFEAAIPESVAGPYQEALTKLQSNAKPMPVHHVHGVLDQQLGTRWRERFEHFDDEPVAAASIGQVHRGVWSSGRPVAVKVQYPGAAEALRGDLAMLNRYGRAFARLTRSGDVSALLAEFSERTVEELDFRIEADNQRAFAAAFDGDRNFLVPRVVASAPRVLITEWLEGIPLSRVIAEGDRAQRDRAARLLAEFHLSAPARAGLLHCDPHPGNFMMTADGRLGVIDFGACARFPRGLPPELGRMVRLAGAGDFDTLAITMRDNGFVQPGQDVEPAAIAQYLRLITEPLKSESFHFTRTWLQRSATSGMGLGNRSDLQTMRAIDLPREYVMIVRVLIGSISMYAQLDARLEFMRLVSELMPGFADPVSAQA
ncbi:ABC1 kinase family protein [Nocardia sp. NPDC127579]|uniref:ABC1 kinase family protein n=1 Tax=Nocardia sp. NPDC127579 TaxID=3345402 RepID=UPI003633BE8A